MLEWAVCTSEKRNVYAVEKIHPCAEAGPSRGGGVEMCGRGPVVKELNVKNWALLRMAVIAGSCMTLGTLVGCQSTGGDGSWDPAASTADDKVIPSERAAKPAPAAETKPAKMESKPAAVSSGRTACSGPGSVRMAFPTGNEATSAVLLERTTPAEVVVGQQVEYKLCVCNLTSMKLTGVVVTDECLDNFKISESSPGGTMRGTATSWNLGDLAAGECKVITVRGTALKAGTFTSCADVKYNSLLCTTTNVVQPAIAITKQMTPESTLNCGSISATFEVKNTGTGTASNVRITDALPAGLTTENGATSLDIPVGNLAAGQTATKTVALKAAKTGRYENNAKAMADGGLTANSNTVATVVKQAVLAVDCKAGGNVYIGRDASFEVTVRNTGDAACDNVSLNLSGAPVANPVVAIGTLAPGASKTITVAVKGGNAGAVNLNASASCPCAAPAQTSCTLNVIGVPDIGTSISDDDGVVTVGGNHVYTYTVVNQGQVDLTGVTMTATLDEGSDFVATSWSPAPTANGKVLTFNVGTVKVGERKTFTITIKGTAEGERGIDTLTKCNELKRTVNNDEQVTYIK